MTVKIKLYVGIRRRGGIRIAPVRIGNQLAAEPGFRKWPDVAFDLGLDLGFGFGLLALASLASARFCLRSILSPPASLWRAWLVAASQ
jgi:hypothetical protein